MVSTTLLVKMSLLLKIAETIVDVASSRLVRGTEQWEYFKWLAHELLSEFIIKFLPHLYTCWWEADPDTKAKYAYNMTVLFTISNNQSFRVGKYNAFIAYCIYRGYTTAYMAMKFRLVSGGESVYTWLRMYRALRLSRTPCLMNTTVKIIPTKLLQQ